MAMKVKKVIKIGVIVLSFILFFIILGASFYAFLVVKDQKLDKTALESASSVKVKIFDKDDCEMDYFSSIKSTVDYREISPYTIYAFVSLEDKRFFSHHGIDYKRIIGALVNNLKAGYFKEGGSTITQQLAKNALLSQEKTIERKLKEAKLSLEIEKNYSKEEIITKYLNTIYFGHSLYGISDAAKRLFNKAPIDLTIGESAILAGIVKNPLKNSPLNSVENALIRRNLVLKLMLEQGYILEGQYESAIRENYTQPTCDNIIKKNIPYTQAVIWESAKLLNVSEREIITGGYEIHTYFDKTAQNTLDLVFNDSNLAVDESYKTFIMASNETLGISAYASSINHSPFQYRRQGASTLKPLVSYAPALENGLILPDSPILDARYTINNYSPQNYQNKYLGWTTARESLSNSSNACSLKLMDLVGKDYCLSFLKNFGLTLTNKDGFSTALGGTTYGQTTIELLSAYATIANGGIYNDCSFIKSIYNKNGNCVYSHNRSEKRVISNETAYFLTDMLVSCAQNGTAKKLGMVDGVIASKTGTNGNANGNFDAWNISYTTTNTLLCWYGSKDYSKPLDLTVTGGSYPTLSASYIQNRLGQGKPFTIPNGVEYAEIDNYLLEKEHVLKLANENTPIEYKKTIIVNENHSLPVSNYFDDLLPIDFTVTKGDGEVIITFTKNTKFNYGVKNSSGELLCKIEKGSGRAEITLPKPHFYLELYYLVAYVDNVEVKKSQPKTIFFWI